VINFAGAGSRLQFHVAGPNDPTGCAMTFMGGLHACNGKLAGDSFSEYAGKAAMPLLL